MITLLRSHVSCNGPTLRPPPRARPPYSLAQVYYSRKPSASRGGYNNPPIIPGGLYPPSAGGEESVLWPFGHGLSYGAKFEYSGIAIDPATVPANGAVEVSLTIRNTGTLTAEEVPQLYIRDEIATVTTPVKVLRGFQRLPPIAPGAAVKVTFAVDVARDLWLVNLTLHKVVEPGSFKLMVGASSDDIRQTGNLTVTA